MKAKANFRFVSILWLAFMLGACPGSDNSEATADAGEDVASDMKLCMPGDVGSCFTCDSSDMTGFHTCNEDGSAWGPCQCQETDLDVTVSEDLPIIEKDEGLEPLPEIVKVSLRVHVLKSSVVPEMNADSAGLGAHLNALNQIWAPSGVEFEVESTIEYEALRQEDFAQLLEVGAQANPELATSIFRCELGDCIFDTDQGLMNGERPGFNIVTLASMGTLPSGTFVASVGYVFHSQDKPPRILARALARALGLNKSGCDDPCNLMRSGQCGPVDEALYLDECQGESARNQAETGSPAPPQIKLECPCNGLVLPGSNACQGHESSCPEGGGGDPEPEPGQGGGGPTKCTTNDDCASAEACPNDGGLGCACADHPSGTPRCLPLCDDTHECPELPNPDYVYVCQEDICMSMGGGGPQ